MRSPVRRGQMAGWGLPRSCSSGVERYEGCDGSCQYPLRVAGRATQVLPNRDWLRAASQLIAFRVVAGGVLWTCALSCCSAPRVCSTGDRSHPGSGTEPTNTPALEKHIATRDDPRVPAGHPCSQCRS
jgi:hypothetical protein